MSLLAFLRLRYSVRMLPILLFEVAWKVLSIAVIAILRLVADDMNAASREGLFNCSSSSSSSQSSRGDTSGGARSGRPETRGVNERTALQPLRRPAPVPTT